MTFFQNLVVFRGNHFKCLWITNKAKRGKNNLRLLIRHHQSPRLRVLTVKIVHICVYRMETIRNGFHINQVQKYCLNSTVTHWKQPKIYVFMWLYEGGWCDLYVICKRWMVRVETFALKYSDNLRSGRQVLCSLWSKTNWNAHSVCHSINRDSLC